MQRKIHKFMKMNIGIHENFTQLVENEKMLTNQNESNKTKITRAETNRKARRLNRTRRTELNQSELLDTVASVI